MISSKKLLRKTTDSWFRDIEGKSFSFEATVQYEEDYEIRTLVVRDDRFEVCKYFYTEIYYEGTPTYTKHGVENVI